MIVDFTDSLDPSGGAMFVGRSDELGRLTRGVLRGLSGAPAAWAVAGSPGSGKSELLRQALSRLVDSGVRILPVYCNLANPSGAAEGDLWRQLIRSLVRHAIAFDRGLALLDSPLLGATPRRLARLCYASGLGAWAAAVDEDGALPGEECWRGILRSWLGREDVRPVIVIDGAAQFASGSTLGGILDSVIRCSLSEGCPLLFEALRDEPELWPTLHEIETLRLGGLSPDESQELVRLWSQQLGGAPPPSPVQGVIDRLGGSPDRIRTWVRAWQRRPPGHNALRRAEEAYLDVLESGPQSGRWRGAIEAAIAIGRRGELIGVLRDLIARDSLSQSATFTPAEFMGRLGLDPPEGERVLSILGRERFLERKAQEFAIGPDPLMRDWIKLQAGLDWEARETGRARAEMLRRLLASHASPPVSRAEPIARRLLGRMALQSVPSALLRCDQYHEALDRMPPERRKAEVMRSSETMTLPEVIGVIPASGPAVRPRSDALAQPVRFALFYAYAYREGTYQRSHEETWIAGDFTSAPRLTSAEVGHFLDAAQALEERLGKGRYVRWLLAGDSISPEAIARIEAERVYCSDAEQWKILISRLEGESAPSVFAEPAPPPTIPVIPVRRDAGAAAKTPTRLMLAAHGENEVMVALMAEKIALRCGFNAHVAGQIRLAALEGALNAIEYSSNPEKEIAVEFFERPGEIEIVIENEGRHFDPSDVEDPDPRAKLSDVNKRGWGIKLMRGFVDNVIHEQTPHGTRLRLIKKIARVENPGGAKAPDAAFEHTE